MTKEGVLFTGLGTMGFPMAKRLLADAIPLHIVTGRSVNNSRRLGADGAELHQSYSQVPSDVRVAMLMLPDGNACRDVVNTVLEHVSSVEVIVDFSTISPHEAQVLAEHAARHGVVYLDAPVSGGAQGAADGSLSIMVGGDALTLSRIRSLLDPLAHTVTHMGSSGAGQTIKACNNLLGAFAMTASSLALSIAERSGIDVAVARDVIQSGTGANWQLANHLPVKALKGELDPGFALGLLLKDLGIARDLAKDVPATDDLLESIIAAYESAKSKFGPHVDFSSIFKLFQGSEDNAELI